MARKSGFAVAMQAAWQVREMTVREHMRTFILDIVTIALGEMGLTKEQIGKFRDTYMEVEEQYCDEIRSDYYGNGDKMMVYAKDRIDRMIKQYVPEDMFLTWEQRYIKK